MRLFLSGGGAGKQNELALQRLNEIIEHDKKVLYIPLAMKPEKYDKCYEWIKGELSNVEISGIDMIRTIEELSEKDFNNYSFIFIGGGNTFKLLKLLKESNNFNRIRQYIENDGIIFGGSAGAIIFGKDIKSCEYMDENAVNLEDTKGFNILNNLSIAAHYTSWSEEDTKLATESLLKETDTIIALPEEDTIYINGNDTEVIGTKPFYIFDNGNVKKYDIEGNRHLRR